MFYRTKAQRRPVLIITVMLLTLITGNACGAGQANMTSTPSSAALRSAPTWTPQDTAKAGRPTGTSTPEPADDSFVEQRRKMVKFQIEGRGVSDLLVLQAMREVPRHKFVSGDLINQAYADHPLPIGYGQTISQPYIVALMTEKLKLGPGDKVLEIGTGSGYQAAVLAEITDNVYTVEIIPELAERATKTLKETGYSMVKTLNADGYYGWEKYAPYDAIIVTAAPDHVPRPLIQQLKEGGRLVIPIGPPGSYQTLWQITKREGKLETKNLGDVRFVPFTGVGVKGGGGER